MHSSLVHGLSFCKVQIILILSIFHINFQGYDSFSVIQQFVIYTRPISFHRKKIIYCTHVDVWFRPQWQTQEWQGWGEQLHNFFLKHSWIQIAYVSLPFRSQFVVSFFFFSFKGDSVVLTSLKHKLTFNSCDKNVAPSRGSTFRWYKSKDKSTYFPDCQLNVVLHRLLDVFTEGHPAHEADLLVGASVGETRDFRGCSEPY